MVTMVYMMLSLLSEVNSREKLYKANNPNISPRDLTEEWIAAVSDMAKYLELRDLSPQANTALLKIGEFLHKSLNDPNSENMMGVDHVMDFFVAYNMSGSCC
jgi:hypothetical protein